MLCLPWVECVPLHSCMLLDVDSASWLDFSVASGIVHLLLQLLRNWTCPSKPVAVGCKSYSIPSENTTSNCSGLDCNTHGWRWLLLKPSSSDMLESLGCTRILFVASSWKYHLAVLQISCSSSNGSGVDSIAFGEYPLSAQWYDDLWCLAGFESIHLIARSRMKGIPFDIAVLRCRDTPLGCSCAGSEWCCCLCITSGVADMLWAQGWEGELGCWSSWHFEPVSCLSDLEPRCS